ncbi:MAG: hypothetical protein Q8Q09_14180 [Deltaproteobacteria bacterium]|nr:hypothetical protein [Deltaproteobacteria bacterium]
MSDTSLRIAQETHETMARWAFAIGAISDHGIRVRVLAERLASVPPDAHEPLEEALLERVLERTDNAAVTLLAWVGLRAAERCLKEAAFSPPEIDWGGRPLALGERKTLARTADRRLLDRALRDPHPDVVREVLLNPRLLELDVTRLCATPRISPVIVARVLTSTRWVSRAAVLRATVLNPASPEELTSLIVGLADLEDLRAVEGDRRISLKTRDRAANMLARSQTLR